MDDSEHIAETELSWLFYDDELGGNEHEKDYKVAEDAESEKNERYRKLDEFFAPLGVRVRIPAAGALHVTSIHKKISTPGACNLSIDTGALNSKRNVDEPFMILPGLYLGSEAHSRNEEGLKRLGVTHIVAIHEQAAFHFPDSFDYLIIPIYDEPDATISKHFHVAHSFIREARETDGGAVFIHCRAGISRSATIVISYIMQLQRISYFEALDITLAAKPDVNPNHGFITQLKAYEKLIGTTSSGRPLRAPNFGYSHRYPTTRSCCPSKHNLHNAKHHGRYFEAYF